MAERSKRSSEDATGCRTPNQARPIASPTLSSIIAASNTIAVPARMAAAVPAIITGARHTDMEPPEVQSVTGPTLAESWASLITSVRQIAVPTESAEATGGDTRVSPISSRPPGGREPLFPVANRSTGLGRSSLGKKPASAEVRLQGDAQMLHPRTESDLRPVHQISPRTSHTGISHGRIAKPGRFRASSQKRP